MNFSKLQTGNFYDIKKGKSKKLPFPFNNALI